VSVPSYASSSAASSVPIPIPPPHPQTPFERAPNSPQWSQFSQNTLVGSQPLSESSTPVDSEISDYDEHDIPGNFAAELHAHLLAEAEARWEQEELTYKALLLAENSFTYRIDAPPCNNLEHYVQRLYFDRENALPALLEEFPGVIPGTQIYIDDLVGEAEDLALLFAPPQSSSSRASQQGQEGPAASTEASAAPHT
jgi:hypothetical protein